MRHRKTVKICILFFCISSCKSIDDKKLIGVWEIRTEGKSKYQDRLIFYSNDSTVIQSYIGNEYENVFLGKSRFNSVRNKLIIHIHDFYLKYRIKELNDSTMLLKNLATKKVAIYSKI